MVSKLQTWRYIWLVITDMEKHVNEKSDKLDCEYVITIVLKKNCAESCPTKKTRHFQNFYPTS